MDSGSLAPRSTTTRRSLARRILDAGHGSAQAPERPARPARALLGVAAATAIALAPGPAAAQDLRVGTVDASAPGVVSVSVDGPRIAKSQAGDYALRFADNAPVKASEVKPAAAVPQAMALVICIDKSGSIGAATLETIKSAFDGFVAQGKPGLSIGLIGFGSATKTIAAFGTEPQTARSRLKALTSDSRDSKTKLFEAVSGGLDQLKAGPAGAVRRLLVISDGKDEGSDTGIERVVDKAHANGVVVDSIGVGRLAPTSSSSLDSLSDRTGGTFVLAKPGESGVADALASILRGYSSPREAAVVTFRYDAAGDAAKLERATLEFTPAGGTPIKSELQGSFAAPAKATEPVVPKSDGKAVTTEPARTTKSVGELVAEYKVPILAVAGLLIAALLLWLFVMTRKRPAAAPTLAPTAVVPPPTGGARPPTRPAPARMTKFARYAFTAPQAGRPVAILRGVSGPIGVKHVPIEATPFRIGADADNELVLAGDDFLSSRHATIRFDSGSLYLSDRGSRNGTFLNGTRLTDVPMPLSIGDELRIGKSVMVLDAPAGAQGGPSGRSPDESRNEGAIA